MIGDAGTYQIVFDGLCPNGYSPLSDETECKAIPLQTISNIGLVVFDSSGCRAGWTPPQTCFVSSDNRVYFVDKDCCQIPNYETHRLVCKKQGNNFLTSK